MLERLIEITNSEWFIQEGHIAIKEVIARTQTFDLKLIFDIEYSFDDLIKYHCEVCCEGIAYTTSNRLHEHKRPYNRINIYKDHPVLWNYEGSLYLTLKGSNTNIPEFIGDLFIAHDKACGNWVDFHWLFNRLPKWLNSHEGVQIDIPKKLFDHYLPVFNKHMVTFTIDESSEYKYDYSVLIFGNPEISPDDYNFGQPYIVAEKFTEFLNQVTSSRKIEPI
jgi:hypothetical protein